MMIQPIDNKIIIQAPTTLVWEFLTYPGLMKQWMGEPELELEIMTNWKVGSPLVIKGFHHIKFVNQGKVLQFEPYKVLKYNYLSSVSRLPDKPENYTELEFRLAPFNNNYTSLTLTISNFPTESIYKHLDFYWKTTIEILKKMIEDQ